MKQSICFVSKSSEGMEVFDEFPRDVKRLFYETEQNICAYCAMNVVEGWTRGPPLRAPIQVWIEVIHQMEQGEISDNPFNNSYSGPEAYADSRTGGYNRRRKKYEREFAYQRSRGRGQDLNPGYDRPFPSYDPYALSRFQQEDRYRDERALAWTRNVQDIERDWTRSLGASEFETFNIEYQEILRNPERTRRWPAPQ